MHDIFDGAHGIRLAQAAYTPDFMERFWRIGPESFWKLERLQYYDEGDFPSWVAFCRGEWEHSLRLMDELRPEYEEYFGKMRDAGFGHHRVRIVEQPIMPYVQWELNILHVKHDYGEQVAVLEAEQVAPYERERPLPELCVLGTEAVYVLDYTAGGVPDGATRYTEQGVVERARALAQELYAAGEGLETYFSREVADMGPPTVKGLPQ